MQNQVVLRRSMKISVSDIHGKVEIRGNDEVYDHICSYTSNQLSFLLKWERVGWTCQEVQSFKDSHNS